jgi:hypothetical protein
VIGYYLARWWSRDGWLHSVWLPIQPQQQHCGASFDALWTDWVLSWKILRFRLRNACCLWSDLTRLATRYGDGIPELERQRHHGSRLAGTPWRFLFERLLKGCFLVDGDDEVLAAPSTAARQGRSDQQQGQTLMVFGQVHQLGTICDGFGGLE